jgi:hypothetical protein
MKGYHQFFRVFCVVALVGAAAAQAEITHTVWVETVGHPTLNNQPVDGLMVYRLHGQCSEPDVNTNVVSFETTGLVHQVWPDVDGSYAWTLDTNDGAAGGWNDDWDDLDTHLLFDESQRIPMTPILKDEQNDGSDPLSLSLTAPGGSQPLVGLGRLFMDGVGLLPTGPAAPHIVFAQIVVPTGQVAYVDGVVASPDGVTGFQVETAFGPLAVPEPATITMLAASLVCMRPRRRA